MAGPLSRYARWRADLSRDDQQGHWDSKREKEARSRYSALKSDLTRAPDGSYPTEMHDGGDQADIQIDNTKAPPLEVNNPLSLSDNNPWHTYFASLSMLDQIKVDVQRAFPEDEVLRSEIAQLQLIRVLFVWSLMKENESVGYRQGMHEIAAICWLVRKDASDLKDRWMEEDTFILFELIMARAKPWYEWKSQPKFPISRRCDAIQAMLFSTDAQLARHLESIGIEMQLFAIRWVRLILTRELPLAMSLEVWDALFSLDPSLDLLDSICVAMLIRIRSQLLDSDYSSAFQALVNYPSYATSSAPTTLIKQAQQISASPTRLTLMSIMQENEEMLEIPTSVKSEDASHDSSTTSLSYPVPPSLSHLTRGVYAQTLSAGLGRALQNVQKTVNAAYMSHSTSNGGSDGFPPLIESVHKSPQPSRGAKAELEEIRHRDKLIGGSMVRVIDVLEKHWAEVLTVQGRPGKSEEATQSDVDFLLCLTTLKHSRDVLMGHTPDFDPSIMDGPKIAEEGKEKSKVDDQKAKDFGQRFKRTVEVAVASPSSTVDSSISVANNVSDAAPPKSSEAVFKATTSPYTVRRPKKEPVNDPLGVR